MAGSGHRISVGDFASTVLSESLREGETPCGGPSERQDTCPCGRCQCLPPTCRALLSVSAARESGKLSVKYSFTFGLIGVPTFMLFIRV